MSLEIEEQGLDHTFIYLGSLLAEPLCASYSLLRYRMVAPLDPTKFDNCTTKTREIAVRALLAIASIAALTTFTTPILFTAVLLGVGSKICRAIGFSLQKQNYTYVRSTAPEKTLNGSAKVMTWNICGIAGGMHYDHGGVISWRSRIDRIAKEILEEDPDVLVLQEIYDASLAKALIDKLGPHYAHFFTHLGANVIGSVGGTMVLCKCAVHHFTNTSFDNNSWDLNRTFAALEIKARPEDAAPCAKIIGTHLIHDDNGKRMAQVAQIVNSLAKKTLPTILTGDLNLERNKPEEGLVLNDFLEHGYLGEEPTCTEELLRQWDLKPSTPGETIDYLSLFKGHAPNVHLDNTHLLKAFDNTYNTQAALSDHHAIVSTLIY